MPSFKEFLETAPPDSSRRIYVSDLMYVPSPSVPLRSLARQILQSNVIIQSATVFAFLSKYYMTRIRSTSKPGANSFFCFTTFAATVLQQKKYLQLLYIQLTASHFSARQLSLGRFHRSGLISLLGSLAL